MFIFHYKKLLFLLFIGLFTVSVKAQQTHFIYLQTDNGEPFYLKLNRKVISSSAQGYVILPNITDGEYHITVGFPKNEHPEQTFDLNIENDNEGFLIKNFDDKGMQLFNLETLALVNGSGDTSNTTVAVVNKNDSDSFSTMLANVVKDSSILQNHQVQVPKPEVKIDSPTVAGNVENSAKSDTTSAAKPVTAPVVPAADSQAVVKNDSVSKILSNESASGLTMLYADKNPDKTDTVSVFMQNPEPESEKSAVDENKTAVISSSAVDTANAPISGSENKNQLIPSSTEKTESTSTPSAAKDTSGFVFRKDSITTSDSNTRPVQVFTIGPSKDKRDKKAEEKTEEKKNDATGSETKTINKAPKGEIVLLPTVVTSSKNSDCKAFATTEDFLRLRKKMASENNQEDMIRTAGKYFRTKCYSTEQIKDLSYLFLTEEGKYMFFDAAYAHTSDSDQYESLESQFTDPYYLNRFKALLRK